MGTLRARHLPRYRDLGALLLKHRGPLASAAEVQDPLAEELSTDHDRDDATTEDAERLVADLEAMGPTFIKLGQLLSTRSDLLPSVYVDALARLQDDVEPFGFADVERIVTAELGVRLSKAFQSFDHRPLASASLGQVHRASLRDGRPVAVKVQRPGIREQVVDDMQVIAELAAFLDQHTRMGRRFGFCQMVEEFRVSIMGELDYRREAANLRLLGSQLADHDQLVVPQPIDDYSTGTVLTMDFVEGRSVRDLSPIARTEIDGAGLAEALLRAYLEQILLNGFVHADPHPGNVLLTVDGRLGLIDLGMTTRVSPGMQDTLLRLLLAVGDERAEDVADVLSGIAEPVGQQHEPTVFRRRISELMDRHRDIGMGQLQAGRVVGDLARVAGECGLRPPPELTMVGKALLNLDQVATILDPDLDPNEVVRDHVADIMRRKVLRTASPGNLLAAAMDAKEFVEQLPGRVNQVMDALAQGELTLNVQGIDERELMRGIQKLANRVTTGLVVAALIIGAAMVMRIETDSTLFGYPTLAIVLFLIASAAGLGLVVMSLLTDLPQRRRRGDGRGR